MKTYKRSEVIERGKKAARTTITVFFVLGLLFLVGAIILVTQAHITDFYLLLGIFLVPTLIALLPFIVKLDPLRLGCNHLQAEINNKVKHPKFKSEELYNLLKESEEVDYYYKEAECIIRYSNNNKVFNISKRQLENKHPQEPFEEIEEYLNGKKEFHEMSDEAQDEFLEDYDGDD